MIGVRDRIRDVAPVIDRVHRLDSDRVLSRVHDQVYSQVYSQVYNRVLLVRSQLAKRWVPIRSWI